MKNTLERNFSSRRSSSALSNFLSHFCSNKVPLTKELIWKGALSAIVGIFLGAICSLVVNCTLVEISLSFFFSLYFGLLFEIVGLVILWRIFTNVNEEVQTRKVQLSFFAILIIISGMICFILKKNWFIGISPVAKIPVYLTLGISIAFALTFSLVDFINFICGFFQAHIARAVVESKAQLNFVLAVSIFMGGIFGFIFGFMDIEDEISYHIRLALLKEQPYCYPIGAILGGIAGFGNEYLRQQQIILNRQSQTDFDDEI